MGVESCMILRLRWMHKLAMYLIVFSCYFLDHSGIAGKAYADKADEARGGGLGKC